jgi:crossover junction endodeoxyribonuclease RuvC
MIRILGIDPGSRKLGWGIIDVDRSKRRFVHVAHGVLRLHVDEELPRRMRELAMRLQVLIEHHQPKQAVLEDVFMSENAGSALILGQARGAVLATLGLHNVDVSSLAATRVKSSIAGSGRASKTQVGEMVRALLALEKRPAEDAGDALALAICRAQIVLSPLEVTAMPAKKRASTKQKQQALYDLAKAQGKI